jgi:hypothetical protein
MLYMTKRVRLLMMTRLRVCAQVKGTLPLTLMKDGRGMVQQCLDSLIDRQTVLEVYLSRTPEQRPDPHSTHAPVFVLQRSNKELRTQNEALFTQRDSALAQLNVLVEEKKAMESDLYNKVRTTASCAQTRHGTAQLTPLEYSLCRSSTKRKRRSAS